MGYNDNVKLKLCTSLNNPGAGAAAEQLFLIRSRAEAGAPSKFALLQHPEQKTTFNQPRIDLCYFHIQHIEIKKSWKLVYFKSKSSQPQPQIYWYFEKSV